MRRCSFVLLGCLIGCASPGPSTERAVLDGLAYSVPAGWSSRDLSDRRARVVVWSPADNTRKETVTIVRTEPLPLVSKTGPDRLAGLLDQAQRSLPRARFGSPTRFTTRHGLAGVRIEGEIVPPLGERRPYRRLHAVLVDATTSSLVHVLYTASNPDSDAFELVIDSLRREV
jgi:hypothetical protein